MQVSHVNGRYPNTWAVTTTSEGLNFKEARNKSRCYMWSQGTPRLDVTVLTSILKIPIFLFIQRQRDRENFCPLAQFLRTHNSQGWAFSKPQAGISIKSPLCGWQGPTAAFSGCVLAGNCIGTRVARYKQGLPIWNEDFASHAKCLPLNGHPQCYIEYSLHFPK